MITSVVLEQRWPNSDSQRNYQAATRAAWLEKPIRKAACGCSFYSSVRSLIVCTQPRGW